MSFKICVVGCGYMALNGHGPALKKYAVLHPEIELAACCDIDESKALEFKNEFGFSRHYTDMGQMLESEKPQAVSLIVPVNLTFPLSVHIFEKGIPLLLEKPPGLNSKETLEMIRMADKRNIPNMVAFNRRYMPLVIKLKELIEQYKLDESMNISYDMLRIGRKDMDFSSTAIHGIDVVKFLAASDYSQARFSYQEMGSIGINIANFYMDCEFKSGSTAQLGFFPMTGMVAERLEINMPQHTFRLFLPIKGSIDESGRLMHFHNGKVVLDMNGKGLSGTMDEFELNGFYNENERFFDDIRSGRKPVDNLESGLQSVEIADCIRNRHKIYIRN